MRNVRESCEDWTTRWRGAWIAACCGPRQKGRWARRDFPRLSCTASALSDRPPPPTHDTHDTSGLPRRRVVCGVCVWPRHRLAEIEGQLGELDGGRDIEGRVAPELLAKRPTSTRRCARRFVVDSSAGSMTRGRVKPTEFVLSRLCVVCGEKCGTGAEKSGTGPT